MHKAYAHWLTGFSDENKHNITFSHYENILLCLPYSFTCYTLQLFGHPGD